MAIRDRVWLSVVENRVAGDLLRLARAKAGLTQDQMAERAGVAQSLISAYENGRRQPTMPTLLRLLEAVGFDLRMRLEGPDLQSRFAEEWASTRPSPERSRWEREQRAALSRR
jgi:transcriptional regulator with XRE-family HTH domain